LSGTRKTIVPGAALAELPPVFDWLFYARHPSNGDLHGFDEAAATNHYHNHGLAEGRVSGPIDGRGAFLRLISPSAPLLEIGPFCTPCFTARTHRVRFLDAFPTVELRKMVAEHAWGKPELVPEIDYVWRGGSYADLIKERFETVFSSHNIEHQPCLVTHLRDVAAVLAPGRRLFLIVPDRRYCFDHYLPESTIADVLDAFMQGRRRHSTRSILEHRLLLTHNEAERHWKGDHGDDPRRRAPDGAIVGRIADHLKSSPSRDSYIDAHAWQFVPESFAGLIRTLRAAGLTPFTVERVYPTLWSSNEFYAVLRLPPAGAQA